MVSWCGVLFLARHGETAWNAEGRLQGRTDVPLSDRGRAQAEALAELFAATRLDAVVTSDLSRARDTGTIVAARRGVPAELVIDPRLRERGFGVFEGLTREEREAKYSDMSHAFHTAGTLPDGAEPTSEVLARMGPALECAAKLAAAGGAVLVVSHGGAMRMWLSHVLSRPIEPVTNGEVYAVSLGTRVSAARWSGEDFATAVLGGA